MNAPSNTKRPVDLYRFEAGLRSAAWTWVARAIASAVARYKARQTARELSALTDEQLRDIGLRRAEIEAIAEHGPSFRA
jgi:uncharacterized protein YjiS (DUF1127 family)